MQIAFNTSELKELAECKKVATKKLGKPCANLLHRRLSELRATDVVSNIPTGRPHPLTGDRLGEFSVRLDGGNRLVFAPNHEETPKLDNDSIDWTAVSKIKITFIGDYHD